MVCFAFLVVFLVVLLVVLLVVTFPWFVFVLMFFLLFLVITSHSTSASHRHLHGHWHLHWHRHAHSLWLATLVATGWWTHWLLLTTARVGRWTLWHWHLTSHAWVSTHTSYRRRCRSTSTTYKRDIVNLLNDLNPAWAFVIFWKDYHIKHFWWILVILIKGKNSSNDSKCFEWFIK